jgi:predicted nucleic acid-binding protein
MADVVIDASAMVDLLLGNDLGEKVAARITGHELHGPTHLDYECLSALGRLHSHHRGINQSVS